MWRWMDKIGSSEVCYRWAGYLSPWLGLIGCVSFFLGVYFCFCYIPLGYHQGAALRIMYLHVPLVVCSLGLYVVMSLASLRFLISGSKVADAVAKVAVSAGVLFTMMALATGILWERSTSGVYWFWDARLTSELVLFFVYCGAMVLRSAMFASQLRARACGLALLIGLISVLATYFYLSHMFTLHNTVSILPIGMIAMSFSLLSCLLLMILAFICLSAWLVLTNLHTELLEREYTSSWVRRMWQEE